MSIEKLLPYSQVTLGKVENLDALSVRVHTNVNTNDRRTAIIILQQEPLDGRAVANGNIDSAVIHN